MDDRSTIDALIRFCMSIDKRNVCDGGRSHDDDVLVVVPHTLVIINKHSCGGSQWSHTLVAFSVLKYMGIKVFSLQVKIGNLYSCV